MYLPFGLRSAGYIFNQLSDALEWILIHNYGLEHVMHILDDVLVIEPSRAQCLASFSTLLWVFMSLRAPLGIELDSSHMEAQRTSLLVLANCSSLLSAAALPGWLSCNPS